jgi:uncharacterized protein YcgI (DUF1989 family)
MFLTPEKLLNTQTIQPHRYGFGTLRKGQTLRICDVEGQQVADFVSLRLNEPTEYLDCVYTNWLLGRWRWNKGDVIYTNLMNAMWTITADTVCDHYTGGGFCSRVARKRFGIDDEKGCRDTLEDALEANGISKLHLQSVSCLNVFMNVGYDGNGSWVIREPKSKAGDFIALRAEMDLLWLVSVCYWPEVVNGKKPTPLRFDVFEA